MEEKRKLYWRQLKVASSHPLGELEKSWFLIRPHRKHPIETARGYNFNMKGKLALGLLVLFSCQAFDFEQELSRLQALKAESDRTGDICELCHSSVSLFLKEG